MLNTTLHQMVSQFLCINQRRRKAQARVIYLDHLKYCHGDNCHLKDIPIKNMFWIKNIKLFLKWGLRTPYGGLVKCLFPTPNYDFLAKMANLTGLMVK